MKAILDPLDPMWKGSLVMSLKNAYLLSVMEELKQRNAHEPEYLQAVEEVLESLEPVIDADPR